MDDRDILRHIEALIGEEERIYGQGHISDDDLARLAQLKVEVDQYWDLIRQRRGLRDAGKDPSLARLRAPAIVENYRQ